MSEDIISLFVSIATSGAAFGFFIATVMDLLGYAVFGALSLFKRIVNTKK